MSLLKHKSTFTIADAVDVARTLYRLPAQAETLPSERDQNFLLTLAGGHKRVLKIANAMESREVLDAENALMRHVADRVSACPVPFPTVGGDLIGRVTGRDGANHFIRLISFLPGRPMGEVEQHSDALLHDLGRKVGQLDRALADFDHPAAHRDLHWDLAHALREIDQYKGLLSEPPLRAFVDSLADDYRRDVVPLLGGLRRSVIQNDPNDYNVIVGGGDERAPGDQRVIGIVDFGDLVYSYTVADLAIAIAYAILDKRDPLAAAAHIVRGYHTEYPLTDSELAALFGLVCMRLCVSVCMAAHQQRQRPDDPYLAISQTPIRNTLPRLADIDPRLAETTFRRACGLRPMRRIPS